MSHPAYPHARRLDAVALGAIVLGDEPAWRVERLVLAPGVCAALDARGHARVRLSLEGPLTASAELCARSGTP